MGSSAGGYMQMASMAQSAVIGHGQAVDQRKMLRFDAKQNEIAAEQTLQAGQAAENRSRLKTSSLMGSQRAELAANGVDLGYGSPADVLASTKFIGDVDAATIRDNYARAAYQQRVGAQIDRSAASAIQADQAMVVGALGNGATVARSWYNYRQQTSGYDPYGASMSARLSSASGDLDRTYASNPDFF